MARSDNRITRLRKDVDRLRHNYKSAFTSANRVVYEGIEQLAEHELAAIKTHYEEALKNLKTLREGGAPRELAAQQLALLQETVDRILANARESLTILDGTRRQLGLEIRENLEGSATHAESAALRAREATEYAGDKLADKAADIATDPAGEVATARTKTADAADAAASTAKHTVKKRKSAASGPSAARQKSAGTRTRGAAANRTSPSGQTKKTAGSGSSAAKAPSKSKTANKTGSAAGRKAAGKKKATAVKKSAGTSAPRGKTGSKSTAATSGVKSTASATTNKTRPTTGSSRAAASKNK